MLHAFFLQNLKRRENLFTRHAKLGLAWCIHDLEAFLAFAKREHTALVVPAAHGLWQRTCTFLEESNMTDIIKIHQNIHLFGKRKVLGRGVIGGKHDVMA